MKNLFLIDAYGLIYRSYYAFISKPLRNPAGDNVSAVFGFFRSLFQIWEEYKPEAIAAVFDSPGPTFRHKMYAEYKATRQKTPEDLHAQIPLVEEILTLMGVSILKEEGYEADDIIASLATRSKKEKLPCYIVSGDKDLLQLVGGSVVALRPDRDAGWKIAKAEDVEAEWGVAPERILDYLSLTGDHSDNVPGVPGVGDKTAAKLMAQYESFDEIWANIDSITPDGLRKKLVAGKESAFLSRKLISLVTELDADIKNLEELKLDHLNREAATPVFLREGMRSLAVKTEAKELPKPAPATESMARPASLFPEYEYKLPKIEVIHEEKLLKKWIKTLESKESYAFDCETDSLDEMNTMPVGFSFALEDGSACYVPIKAPDALCMPPETIKKHLAPLLADKRPCIIGHNLKFDIHVMENWGCPIYSKPWDTMVAAWLLDPEQDSLKLERLGERFLGHAGSSFGDIVPKGECFSSVNINTAAAYCAEDSIMAMELKKLFEKQLKDNSLLDLFEKLEMPVLGILAEAERNGILVDPDALRHFGKELDEALAKVQSETFALVGHEFNLNSPKQLQVVLFEERKLDPGKKTKTGYSTDTSVLEVLAAEDRVPELILRHRSLAKLKSTYVDGLLEAAKTDPRIRTHFIQTGTATGRLSSRDPNLQNIPVREEEGRRIRKAFIAPPGSLLISADYSQIELVVFAHLSKDPELSRAFREGSDIHKRTAALIFNKEEDSVDTAERRIAKTINFGVIYGMGAFRLAKELGIARSEAQRFIDAYFARYTGVAAFIKETVEEAKSRGYVTTLLGRRRYIGGINSRNANERQAAERAAVNSPIQGSAADIVKLAMIRVDRLLKKDFPSARLLLQVHDELIVEAPAAEAEALGAAIADEMAKAMELGLPLRVGIEISQSWGDMH
ncbi:DNA polymerase I [Spirochaetota bacterium]